MKMCSRDHLVRSRTEGDTSSPLASPQLCCWGPWQQRLSELAGAAIFGTYSLPGPSLRVLNTAGFQGLATPAGFRAFTGTVWKKWEQQVLRLLKLCRSLEKVEGNVPVCKYLCKFKVWKNHHMRTVTNYFIVNLSLADILVTITCLPATLVVDITETWFFGQTLCKVIPYLQTVSVSVSVLTLSCIALDRWYAICHPLMFKSTAKRARNSIIIIWIVSCIIMIPQAIVMECSSVFPGLANKTTLFTVCDEHWGAEVYPKMYHTCFFLVTYMAPLCLMVLAYLQIFRKLWCRQIPGTSSVVQKKWKPQQPSAQPRGLGQSTKSKISAVAAEIKQIRARRKTARMLMVVLLVFALCYLPISILNVLKRVLGMFNHADDRETVYAWFTFSHWLVYANSAANPIIYNFLSGKFREEFKAAFSCCIFGIRSHHDERFNRGRASTESRKSLTTQISNFDNVSKLSEHVVLTNINTIPSNDIPAMLSPLKSAELHLHIPGMNVTSNIDEAMRVSAEDTVKPENAEMNMVHQWRLSLLDECGLLIK
ncbi:hypothetical protein EK904_000087 [Melospiza melodia maxima]|nr:hypothetical protein EK904_000087 [Melospiza melodia maxima]